MNGTENSKGAVTCVAKFRPVILVSAVAVVVVTGWVLLNPARVCGGAGPGRGMGGFGRGPGGGILAATAPRISANAKPPHPDFGYCTRCHDVTGATTAPTKQGSNLVPAAAGPPIAANAKATHPDWGACVKCHKITGTPPKSNGPGAAPVAFTGVGQAWLGARLQDLTDGVANRLDMEVKKGVLVTAVLDGSIAAGAGLTADDVIVRVNNQDIAGVADLQTSIAALGPGSKVKLQIARGESKKNAFLRLPSAPVIVADTNLSDRAGPLPSMPTTQAPAPAQLVGFPVQVPGRVAIAATAADEDAQVAPVFGEAPHFLVRDGPASPWLVTRNPYAGQVNRGQATAQMLARYGVSAVVAGNVGSGAFRGLQGAGIQVYSGAFGSARVVYEQYLLNQLVPSVRTTIAVAAIPSLTGTVAVAAMGPTLDAPVCPNLVSSPYFVFFDLGTRATVASANPSPGDASPGNLLIVQFLADRGATAVIAGNASAPTASTLSSYGVMGFFGVEGKVDDAINMYAAGALRAATVPNIPLAASR